MTLPSRPLVILRTEQHFLTAGLHLLLSYDCGLQGPGSQLFGLRLSPAWSGAFLSRLSTGRAGSSGGWEHRSREHRRADRAGIASRPRASSVPAPEVADRPSLPLASVLTTPEPGRGFLRTRLTGVIPPGAASSVWLLPSPAFRRVHFYKHTGLFRMFLRGPKSFMQLLEPQPCCCALRSELKACKAHTGIELSSCMSHPPARCKSAQNHKARGTWQRPAGES